MSSVGIIDARAEVGWFFAAASAAMGLHGQGLEGGGGAVWDDVRCDKLHASRLSVSHRMSVGKYERVLGTVRQLSVSVYADLRDVYVPFGAGRISWQAYCCFSHEGRQLLALMIRTPEFAAAYERRKGGAGAPGRGGLGGAGGALAFVADRVAHLDHKTIRPGHALPGGHPLEPALRAAIRREGEAIAVYNDLREKRIARERDARERYFEEVRRSIAR